MKRLMFYLFSLVLLLVPVPTTIAQSSCSQGGSNVPVDLTAPNLTDRRLQVYWIDFNCVEQLNGVLNRGEIYFVQTYDGHEWIIRDESGAEVMQFVASASSPVVNIGDVAYNPQPVQSDCSANATDTEIQLRLINNSHEPVLLNWIGFDCSEILYRMAQPGDTLTQNTYIGHDWVVRFADGVVADQITVSADLFTVVIDPRPGTTAPEQPEIVYPITESECVVAPVTPDMGLDPFYGKYCEYEGLPIVSSGMVSNSALKQAWLVIANMFAYRDDVIQSLVDMNFKVVIMGEDEVLTDVPELASVAADVDNEVREHSKFREEPRVIVTGEENLLCFRDDINHGEITLVDTMGNATRFDFLFDLEPTFDDNKLEAIYQNALSEGLWYQPVTEIRGNYWKHGVQVYFNSADAALLTGSTDDEINTRAELAEYDPQLFDLIDSIYRTEEWFPECP